MNFEHDSVNTTELIKWLGGLITLGGSFWKYIDYKFAKEKLKTELEKADKEEFITKVAKAAVEGALNSVLGDVKDDISTLFKYREDDRKHIDKKFDMIMLEVKK